MSSARQRNFLESESRSERIQLQEEETPVLTLSQTSRKSRRCQQRIARKRTKREQKRLDRFISQAYHKEHQRLLKSIKLEFGLIADPNLSIQENVRRSLVSTNFDKFFDSCLNRSCHNLCKTNHIPRAVIRLLGLGLKFCIMDKVPPSDLRDFDFDRFRDQIRTRFFFIDNIDDEESFEPKIYVKNPDWVAPAASLEVEAALDKFQKTLTEYISQRYVRSFRPNLLYSELGLIGQLRRNKNVIVLATDKNLGPAIMDRDEYITLVLQQHLLNEEKYTRFTAEEAKNRRESATDQMWSLIDEFSDVLSDEEAQYWNRSYKISKHGDKRTSQFYGAPKVHKTPLKLRPIVSTSGTSLEILSVFLDFKLQEVVKFCPFYLKDSMLRCVASPAVVRVCMSVHSKRKKR